MNVCVKKVNENAILPHRATISSAGADLYACLDEDVVINPSERLLIPTGIAMAIPEGYGGFIFPRSGTASKYGISLSNCVGVVDSDYRGEIKIAIINHSKEAYTVKNGDRIAQMVIIAVDLCSYTQCDSLDETARGEGGFGSTGK